MKVIDDAEKCFLEAIDFVLFKPGQCRSALGGRACEVSLLRAGQGVALRKAVAAWAAGPGPGSRQQGRQGLCPRRGPGACWHLPEHGLTLGKGIEVGGAQ